MKDHVIFVGLNGPLLKTFTNLSYLKTERESKLGTQIVKKSTT